MDFRDDGGELLIYFGGTRIGLTPDAKVGFAEPEDDGTPGEWITIGGGPGPRGESHAGGFPVKIAGGTPGPDGKLQGGVIVGGKQAKRLGLHGMTLDQVQPHLELVNKHKEAGKTLAQAVKAARAESAASHPALDSDGNPDLSYLLGARGKVTQIGAERSEVRAPRTSSGVAKYISPDGSYRYVWHEKGKPVSVLQVMSRDKHHGIVANVWTDPAYRRQGFAGKLLAHAKQDFLTLTHGADLSPAATAWKQAVDPQGKQLGDDKALVEKNPVPVPLPPEPVQPDAKAAAIDPLDLTPANVGTVWKNEQVDILRDNPKLSENAAGSLATARILNNVRDRANEYIADIDQKVAAGKSITDAEDARYIAAGDLRKQLYNPLVKLSGYRPMGEVDEDPLAKKSLATQNLTPVATEPVKTVTPAAPVMPVSQGAPTLTPLPSAKEPWQQTRAELSEHMIYPPNNSMTAWQGQNPPVGTWRIDPHTEGGELEQLREFNPKDLGLTEDPGDVKNRDDYQQYVQWAKEGKEPPAITVVRNVDGTLKSCNRRRTMAAMEAGIPKIKGWFVDTDLATGRLVWTHKGEVEKALAAGKPVPKEVLADYPDLAATAKTTPTQPTDDTAAIKAQYDRHVDQTKELDRLEGGWGAMGYDDFAKLSPKERAATLDEFDRRVTVGRERKADNDRQIADAKSMGEFVLAGDMVYRRKQGRTDLRESEWKPVGGFGYPVSYDKMLEKYHKGDAKPLSNEQVADWANQQMKKLKDAADEQTKRRLEEMERRAKKELDNKPAPQQPKTGPAVADEWLHGIVKDIDELKTKHGDLLVKKQMTDRFKKELAKGNITPERYQELQKAGTALSDEDYKTAQDVEKQIEAIKSREMPVVPEEKQPVVVIDKPPPAGWQPEDKIPERPEKLRHEALLAKGEKPWTMTQQEWDAKAGGPTDYNYNSSVRKAINSGEEIPARVLDQSDGSLRAYKELTDNDRKYTPAQKELMGKKATELNEEQFLEQQKLKRQRTFEHNAIYYQREMDKLGSRAAKKRGELELQIRMAKDSATPENMDKWSEVNKEYYRRRYREEVKAAISKGVVTDPKIIGQHPEFELARTARERYEKGLHTSFANKSIAVDDSMKSRLGYKAKQQDGKELTPENKAELEKGIGEIENAVGPLKDLFDFTDVTLAHTNGKHPFLSTAGGVYSPNERTVTSGTIIAGFYRTKALAHEIGHWLDFESGSALGYKGRIARYSSARGSRGKIVDTTAISDMDDRQPSNPQRSALIELAKNSMSREREAKQLVLEKAKDAKTPEEKLQVEAAKVELGPYWTSPCEVWARLFEQYVGDQNGMEKTNVSHKANYFDKPAYWDQPTWEKLKPLVRKEIERRLDILREAAAKTTKK